jgi:predicted metal-dependent phosphoesterase TrpH
MPITPRRRRHDAPADPVVPPAPSTVDLHTHTRRSDGVLEPAELVAEAFAAGVRVLSVTDHDNLAGYREAAVARPAGLQLIPGVEINCVVAGSPELWEGELHVLGLGVDPDDDAFEAAMAEQRGQRRRRFERMIARLRELGMPVDDALAGLDPGDDDALGRPTVARALMAKGLATSVEDAFQRLLGRGKPAYGPRDGLGPVEAIRAVRDAGGIAVLAHFSEAAERIDLVRELVGVGLGGLEVYYRTFDRPTVAAVSAVARDLALVATGGSDYHGDLGPYATSHAELWVPREVGRAVQTALAAH